MPLRRKRCGLWPVAFSIRFISSLSILLLPNWTAKNTRDDFLRCQRTQWPVPMTQTSLGSGLWSFSSYKVKRPLYQNSWDPIQQNRDTPYATVFSAWCREWWEHTHNTASSEAHTPQGAAYTHWQQPQFPHFSNCWPRFTLVLKRLPPSESVLNHGRSFDADVNMISGGQEVS